MTFEIQQTQVFARWFRKLDDLRAKQAILARIRRLSQGNPGDRKALGGGISELRIDIGPGYRLYYKYRMATVVLLLCAGDKSTQVRDIERARVLADEID